MSKQLDVSSATVAVSAADEKMAAFIRRHGPYPARDGLGDHFGSLVRAICFQQLAGKAATSIHARTVAAVGGTMTPEAIVSTSVEALRAAGLSSAKAAALIDLAGKVIDRTVPLEGIESLDDEQVIRSLSQVRGIGRWTAEMFLLFELRRPDVWPVDDFGVRQGWSLIYSLPAMIKPRQLAPEGERFRPYRSLVAFYCWHAVHISRGEVVLPGGEAG